MENQNIKSLLERIFLINKKYESIAEVTGENFNVFKILKVESSEVGTHSALISELLNPKGSHGQKDVFLKAFLDLQKEKRKEIKELVTKLENFETEKSVASTESFIGFINEDETEGGRIDILIRDENSHCLIIENKIYAGDQPKQLIRYNNAYKEAPIFYLTLKHSIPSDESKGHLVEGIDFFCISYEDDILNWLSVCKKEAASHPILRETIIQYINLIKYLTGHAMNELEKNEIIEQIINNGEYIETTQKISEVWTDIKLKIISNLKLPIEEIAKELNLQVQIDKNLGTKDTGFWFYKNDWKKYCISFYFEADYDLYVGIDFKSNDFKTDSNDEEKTKIELKEKLRNVNIDKYLESNKYWIWVCSLEDWAKTDWKDVSVKAPKYFKEIVEKILKKVEGLNL